MSSTRVLALSLVAAMAVSACGNEPDTVTAGTAGSPATEATETSQGGFGAPVADGELALSGATHEVTGTVEIADNGCWYVRLNETARLVVFPEDWEFADSSTTKMRGPSGISIGQQPVDGRASFVHRGDLAADGKWDNYMEFCRPQVPELVVFVRLAPAYEPGDLTVVDQRAAVEAADFVEHWPCGRGWAIGTADQRIAIWIYQVDDAQPTPGAAVELPDPGWSAELVLGKHLFANHCNDAIEEWMPTLQVVTRLPISGTITLLDDAPASADPPAPVRASLTDASIDLDGDEIRLVDLDLRNDAYNAFAG